MRNDPSFFQRPAPRIGIVVSVIWLGIVLLSLNTADWNAASSTQILLAVVAFVLPIILIWIAILIAHSMQRMQAEAAVLRKAMENDDG